MDRWNRSDANLETWMPEEGTEPKPEADPESTIEPVLMERTKSGYGLKILVNGVWLYASERAVVDVLRNWTSCAFRPASGFRKPQAIKMKPRVP